MRHNTGLYVLPLILVFGCGVDDETASTTGAVGAAGGSAANGGSGGASVAGASNTAGATTSAGAAATAGAAGTGVTVGASGSASTDVGNTSTAGTTAAGATGAGATGAGATGAGATGAGATGAGATGAGATGAGATGAGATGGGAGAGGATGGGAGAGGVTGGGAGAGAGGEPSETGAGGSGDMGAAGAETMGEAGADTSGGECDLTLEGEGADLFSSFIISYEALQREATEKGLPDPELGLGGDLGGLAGADAICQRAAEFSTPCAGNKTWKAFLSASTEDAIDRIGSGPWYDRLGRKIADSLTDLLGDSDGRPIGVDEAIRTDWPNEYGIPNHAPDGEAVDNHEVITGSGEDGRLYSQQGTGSAGASDGCNDDDWSAERATCNDWTSSEREGCPRVGHSWYEGSGFSGKHWISVWNEGGCGRGVNLVQRGGIEDTGHVGSAGGYGGYYCFAVTGE